MQKKSFLIVGMGRFGTSLARALSKMGHEVMVVDRDEEQVASVADFVTHALVADASEERVFLQLGVSNFDCVVVAVGDDLRSSVLITVLCKEQGAKKVVAKANDDLHAKLLIKTGADKTVMPERDTGLRLAHTLASERVLDFIELSSSCGISEIHVPAAWVGKSIRTLDIRAKYRVSIVAIKRGEKVNVAVDPNYILAKGDEIVMLGANQDLEQVEAL